MNNMQCLPLAATYIHTAHVPTYTHEHAHYTYMHTIHTLAGKCTKCTCAYMHAHSHKLLVKIVKLKGRHLQYIVDNIVIL